MRCLVCQTSLISLVPLCTIPSVSGKFGYCNSEQETCSASKGMTTTYMIFKLLNYFLATGVRSDYYSLQNAILLGKTVHHKLILPSLWREHFMELHCHLYPGWSCPWIYWQIPREDTSFSPSLWYNTRGLDSNANWCHQARAHMCALST